jgi:putative ABC transport system ATP-binding protein
MHDPDGVTGRAGGLSLRGVTKTYGSGDAEVQALRGVDLEIEPGELVVVLGPSGSGKTTLVNIVGGIEAATTGDVIVAGETLSGRDPADLSGFRRRHIGFVFQFFNLLPMLTADENIRLPLSIAGEKPDAEWYDNLVEKVGLADRLKHRPAELSGGQQQRVAIARALVSRPTVVFADEPTGNLDSKTGGEILELMRDSVDSYGQSTVMVTHDARAAAIADRILFLADGKIVKDLGKATAHDVVRAMEELDHQ